MALGHQHPLGLAQHFVGIVVAFQHVRQREQVDALAGERQLQRIGRERRAGLQGERKAVGNAVLPQEIDVGQADLYCPEAEHILYCTVKLGKLPVEDVRSLGRGKPPGKR